LTLIHAGAIALLAGFVLYRLQLLNTDINSLAERLASWIDGIIQHKSGEMPGNNLFVESKYSKLLDLANQTPIPQDNYYRAEAERERLAALLSHKTTFIRNFYVSLYLTAGLITVSIFTLIKTQSLSASCWASWILAGAVFWFSGCILSYLWLLHNVFHEKSIKEGSKGIEPRKEEKQKT
jgi:hypothetical protein